MQQFKDYCDLVSPNNCTEPDDAAQRAPNEEELHRYYVADVYTGHFRATEENDCDLNPTNCTGHVGDYPCGWSSFLLPQMYHLNIALRSSGMEKTSNGYSYQQLSDLWAAANATKSDLMTVWWLPEALYSTYLGTEAEMTRVTLTPPTQECIENRIFASERCEATSFEDLVGDPRGACDEAPQMLHKVITSSLYSAIYDPSIPDARRSPAYDAIKAFTITELQLGEILKAWLERDVDRYGFDGRLATCQWVGNNLDYLSDFIPRSYPRLERQEDSYESAIFFPAIIIGALSTLTVITTIGLTYYWRATYVLQFAQVEFLFLLLVGLFMVAAGSVLLAIEPTDGTCTCLAWLISLGYTLELVPLIVKVGAINKLLNAAKRMRRVKLSRLQLFGTVAALSAIVISFLVLWTTLDPQQRSSEYTLTDETTEYGETVVTLNYFCSSDSQTWRYITVGWHLVLLICATVLAFQTRNIREGFNESQVLAFMIYSHFFFVVLRVITFILGNAISESYLAGLRSMIYSTDTLVTISIYFIPKFLTDDQNFVQNSRRGSLSNFPPQHSRNFSDGSYAAFSLSLNNADNSYNNDNDFTGRQDDSEDKCDDGDAGDRAIYSDVEQHQQGVMSSYLTKHSRKNSIDSIPSVPPSSLKPTSNDGDATENGSDDRNTNSNGHRVSFALQTDDDGLVDCNNSSDPTINETDDRRNNNSNVHRVSFDVPKDCDDQVDC